MEEIKAMQCEAFEKWLSCYNKKTDADYWIGRLNAINEVLLILEKED